MQVGLADVAASSLSAARATGGRALLAIRPVGSFGRADRTLARRAAHLAEAHHLAQIGSWEREAAPDG